MAVYPSKDGGIHIWEWMKLKDLTIRNAKATESPYKLTDGRGRHLQITPSGGKLWRWDYRHDWKRKTMALGNYPYVPLLLARERHAQGRGLLAAGTAPWRSARIDAKELPHLLRQIQVYPGRHVTRIAIKLMNGIQFWSEWLHKPCLADEGLGFPRICQFTTHIEIVDNRA